MKIRGGIWEGNLGATEIQVESFRSFYLNVRDSWSKVEWDLHNNQLNPDDE